jgi:hypothetical protein
MTAEKWFTVARDGGWRPSNGRPILVPRGTVHAKQLGTTRTACGETAYSWKVFWGATLPAGRPQDCVRCTQAVRERGGNR